MIAITETTISIRWVDLDAYGHLNNSKYYDFMTECRGHALLPFADLCNFVVIENSCKYKKQVGYPCSLIVKQNLKDKGNASFELIYQFVDKENGTIYAEGFAKMVCFDKEKNAPIRIPLKISEFLNKFKV